MSRMKKKILLVPVLLFALCGIFRYITPDLLISNKTDKVVYIRSMQYAVTNEEPTDAEMAQIKRVWAIQPGEDLRFLAYYSSLFAPNLMYLSSTWHIGSLISTTGGGHGFNLTKNEGSCRITIEVHDDLYKITPVNKFFCYKKLKPVAGQMIIHSEEKTIFNDYGPNTDKIEKQFIRLN